MPEEQRKLKLYTYRYIPKNLVLTLDQTYLMLDGTINYISFIHDYDNRRLPIIRLHIEVETKLVALLFEYAGGDGRIKFDIYEEKYDYSGDKVNTRMYMTHTWSYIPAKDKSEYLTSEDQITEGIVDEMRTLQLFECYLIDLDALNWFTKQISLNFRDTSKPAILQALLEMHDVPAKITIATPPMDYGTIHDAVFPYGDLIGNITHFNDRYGIYDNIPVIYYDIFYLYIINQLNPNVKVEITNEYDEIVLTLLNAVRPERQMEGSTDDPETKSHYINLKHDPVIIDVNQRKESTRFDTITMIDKNGNVVKQNLNEGESESTAMIYTYNYNTLSQDQVINNNLGRGRSILVRINNSCVSFLRPYKRVSFKPDTQFKDLNLEGKTFRIKGWTNSITREGGLQETATYLNDVTMSIFEQMK